MAIIYDAPKPTYSAWEWFKFVALRIVFPLVLLWDFIQFRVNALFGEQIGELVLPAQQINFNDWVITDDILRHVKRDDLLYEKYEVITHDGAHLDTLEVRHSSQENLAPSYQTYIIYLAGNAMCYEQLIDDMQDDAKTLKTNGVGFNFRGVNQSTGKAKSANDLVTDAIAEVQRLLDRGVSPQNITLKGHSLGAGVAALVAQHFHLLDKPINIFSSRSFSSITNFLVGQIRLDRDQLGNAIGQKESAQGIMLGWLVSPFIQLGVALTQWEINAGSAFRSIPEAYRDYIVVRSRKEIRERRLDDAVIPHYASIHKALTAERHKKKAEMDEKIKCVENRLQASHPSMRSALIEEKKSLIQAREHVKNDRKMEADIPYADGHNAGWQSLHNRSGLSAQVFFREFVLRADKDHFVKFLPSIG